MRRSRLLASVSIPCALAALLVLSLPAAAHTAPLAGPNGEQCECVDAAGGDAGEAMEAKPAAKRPVVKPTNRARPAAPYRTEGGTGRTTPRWHRFLPGMFR